MTLNAHNDVVIDKNVVISSSSNPLNVFLNADIDHSGSGFVMMSEGSRILSYGGVVGSDADSISMEKGSSIVTNRGAVTSFNAQNSVVMNVLQLFQIMVILL